VSGTTPTEGQPQKPRANDDGAQEISAFTKVAAFLASIGAAAAALGALFAPAGSAKAVAIGCGIIAIIALVLNIKSRDTRRAITISTGLAVAVAAASGGAALVRTAQHTDAAVPASKPLPYVHITSLTWVPKGKGRYEVTGIAKNLEANQVLWTFNRPIIQNEPSIVYPDPGPCAPDDKGIFDCSLGFASGTPTQYNIIVAVVTDQQAYGFAMQKAKLIPQVNYPSTADLPHVEGPDTLDSTQSTRTNCRTCNA
jgi:hypothetical protein